MHGIALWLKMNKEMAEYENERDSYAPPEPETIESDVLWPSICD